MKTKMIIVFLGLCSWMQLVQAQFVDIEVNLRSGSTVEFMGAEVQGAVNKNLSIQGTAGASEKKTALRWLRISTAENVVLSVEIGFPMTAVDEKQASALYLNDGTNNIVSALPFTGNKAVFSVNNKGKLIQEMEGTAGILRAWIGIPAETTEVMISYN